LAKLVWAFWTAEIRRMFIDPTCQHQGFGKRIMGRLLRRAKRQGLQRVTLDASLPAKRFYESFGFSLLESASIPVGGRGRLKYYKMAKPLR
jgi:N-acetylglutamate synthase-like GNAT family acetyltransferase